MMENSTERWHLSKMHALIRTKFAIYLHRLSGLLVREVQIFVPANTSQLQYDISYKPLQIKPMGKNKRDNMY